MTKNTNSFVCVFLFNVRVFLFNVRVLFFNNLFRKNIRTFGFKNEQKDENVLKYTFSLRILMK
ncbi:hypothetical protein DYG24_12415 [Enterococcus faecalis]|nr:hypothetical protein [Enterococcus faecalis]